VRASTVFTTHTPVPAGIDRFSADLKIHVYFGGDCAMTGIPLDRLLALGARDLPRR
jgi:starch phosphorylase